MLFLLLSLILSWMATASGVSGSNVCSTSIDGADAPFRKWTCAALKSWLKARGLSYSGMRKDQHIAK